MTKATMTKAAKARAADKLRRVFGKGRVTMFEMNKHFAEHSK